MKTLANLLVITIVMAAACTQTGEIDPTVAGQVADTAVALGVNAQLPVVANGDTPTSTPGAGTVTGGMWLTPAPPNSLVRHPNVPQYTIVTSTYGEWKGVGPAQFTADRLPSKPVIVYWTHDSFPDASKTPEAFRDPAFFNVRFANAGYSEEVRDMPLKPGPYISSMTAGGGPGPV